MRAKIAHPPRVTHGFDVGDPRRDERRIVVEDLAHGDAVRHVKIGTRIVSDEILRRNNAQLLKFLCALLRDPSHVRKLHPHPSFSCDPFAFGSRIFPLPL